MSDKKWSNQGGSDFHGGSTGKGRVKKIDDPFKRKSIDELKESEITSFRLVKQRKAAPNHGNFGDAVWVTDLIPDDIRDLTDPYKFPDLSTDQPKDAAPFPVVNDIRDVPTPSPDSDLPRFIKSQDIIPYSVNDEYELIVKFKKVILTISSGQAFAARNRINDPKYDQAIVIQSTQPIVLNTSIFIIEQNTTARTVNIIQLKNGSQDPILSLYDWMMTKTKIVTDGTGKNTDVELLSISQQGNAKRLPDTRFTYDGKEYGLFYVQKGTQPFQICMHARDDVLKFVAGNPKDDRYWSVLNANSPRALCTPNMATVSVSLAPGSASELEAGSNEEFVLDVVVDPIQSSDTLVEYEILGSASPVFYTVTGTSLDSDGVPIVNIPNINDKTISIEPLSNPGQVGNRSIIFKLKENDRYLIDEESVTLTILPKVRVPTVSIQLDTASVSSLQAGGGSDFILKAFADTAPNVSLLVEYEIIGTASPVFYSVSGVTLDILGTPVIDIASTNNAQISISPLANPSQVGSRTIVFKLKPNNRYLIDPMFNEVVLTILEKTTSSLPVVSLSLVSQNQSLSSIGSVFRFVFEVSVSPPQLTETVVSIDIGDSLSPQFFSVSGRSAGGFGGFSSYVARIQAGGIEQITATASTNTLPSQVAGQFFSYGIMPHPSYSIDVVAAGGSIALNPQP